MKSNRRSFLKKAGLTGLGFTGLGFLGGSKPGYSKPVSNADQVTGDLRLLDWEPIPQLVVQETIVTKPKFPVIDIHNHLRDLDKTDEYLKAMDEAGVWKVVSLDGRSEGEFFKEHIQTSKEVSEDRFIIFFRPDFNKIDEPDFGKKEADKLEEAVNMGVRGIKIAKSLGLTYKDKNGDLVKVDDPRIDPVWARAGELGIPVLMHISDPKAFFTPIDRFNERYDELGSHPDWGFSGPEFPEKEELLRQRNRVIERHPNTTFIATHMANLPEELGRVSMWLEKYPNMYVDIDARISELGRQPYTARKFMIKHQDRILFGTDTPPNVDAYRVYYRFLETDDEYINADPSHHRQGRWRIYGLYLPDEVLEKIYNKNALKIFEQFKG
ncbi:amidohydrolase family protein [Rhodohalobacter sp. 614A]|uniref:amidohydrolase family protein n=1 Tax=Rhodohalobacter sp. 614A TaxID=2908649 RepID=UPI001F3EDC00|nr:amidohydrolase family protein [Rhodohalobacter sp. 614A]